MPEKSSYWYNSTPSIGSTDQIISKSDIGCLDICEGDRLTTVQNAIISKLCEINGIVDMSSIQIPDCLKEAFGTQNLDILTLIQFLLESDCNIIDTQNIQQTQIDSLIKPVELEYPCCDDSCIAGVTLSIPDHLQKIIFCLCDLNTTVTEQATTISDLENSVESLETQLATAQSDITDLETTTTSLQNQINAIKLKTDCLPNC